MRLIDADEAIINFGFEWDDISPTRDEFVAFLKKQPTIDAVPVVRCRECKYYEIHKPKVLENCERKGYIIPMKPDDFCSYGERKEGAE